MLQDIAALTNAKFINKDLQMNLKDVTMDDLGTIKKIIVTKDNTTMISSSEQSEALKVRINDIKAQLENINLIMIKNNYKNV